jgi:hypothetical protein
VRCNLLKRKSGKKRSNTVFSKKNNETKQPCNACSLAEVYSKQSVWLSMPEAFGSKQAVFFVLQTDDSVLQPALPKLQAAGY